MLNAPARPAPTAPAPEPVHPYDRLRSNGHTGFVLFTSGSSGTPKAVVHDLDRFLSRFDHRRPAGRTLAVLGLDHIGGLNTLFHTLTGQGTLVIPPDRDPITLAQTIERWRVEVLPATPTCLRLMLHADAWQRHDLSSLRLITYGAEPMSQTALDAVRAAAPQARLLQTYGSSELGILRTRSLAPGSLGITVQHAETQVRDGVLWVRSPHSMIGYLNAPSPFDPEGWYCTGDRVELIDGALRIVSRTDRLLNIGGEKVDPAEIETILEQIPGILSAHVRSDPSPWTGEIIAAHLIIEHPEDPVTLRNRVRRFCSDRLPPHKTPVRVQGQQGPPMTDRLKKPSPRVLLPDTDTPS